MSAHAQRTDRQVVSNLIVRFENVRQTGTNHLVIRDLSLRQVELIEEALKGCLFRMVRKNATWLVGPQAEVRS